MITVRAFIAVAAASLIAASMVHFELLLDGYRHQEAGTSEAVIAAVMLVGLALTWGPPAWRRRAALGALGFGLLGALVGLFTIAIGVGPQTAPDMVYHAALLALLATGLVVALRTTR